MRNVEDQMREAMRHKKILSELKKIERKMKVELILCGLVAFTLGVLRTAHAYLQGEVLSPLLMAALAAILVMLICQKRQVREKTREMRRPMTV